MEQVKFTVGKDTVLFEPLYAQKPPTPRQKGEGSRKVRLCAFSQQAVYQVVDDYVRLRDLNNDCLRLFQRLVLEHRVTFGINYAIVCV